MYTNNRTMCNVDFYQSFKKIRKSRCFGKMGDTYLLICRIVRYGVHEYCYNERTNVFAKRNGTKKIQLEGKAKKKVANAIALFQTDVRLAKNEFSKVPFEALNTVLYYKHVSKNTYHYLIEKNYNEKEKSEQYMYYDGSIRDIINNLLICVCKGEKSSNIADDTEKDIMLKNLRCSYAKNITLHPLYISAVENKDIHMQRQIRKYYFLPIEKKQSLISKCLGIKVLPSLSQDYDKNYIVDADTISRSVLRRSGYVILHRPYFAMTGSTHEKWQLNPHRKRGVDAAKIVDDSISFDEYLKMFETFQNKS